MKIVYNNHFSSIISIKAIKFSDGGNYGKRSGKNFLEFFKR